MVEIEKSLTETLGTRVIIETNAEGGRLLIDFFSPEDLSVLAASLVAHPTTEPSALPTDGNDPINDEEIADIDPIFPAAPEEQSDDELYSVSGFTV